MDSRLQRRIQRYGWDLAATRYEALWASQLLPAQAVMLKVASPRKGEHVLDVACGTGLVAIAAAKAVGAAGQVLGTDVSGRMIDEARAHAASLDLHQAAFERMDAESLALSDGTAAGGFDLVLCALGLMYFPDPRRALSEAYRVLRPGGRVALAVWGEAARCGWSSVFAIVDAEVCSDVCPLFFQTGAPQSLTRLCTQAAFTGVREHRIAVTLDYASADDACDAALVGGPVALAWSRFDEATRERVRARYLETLSPWRNGSGRYQVPGEFVIVSGQATKEAAASKPPPCDRRPAPHRAPRRHSDRL